MNNDLMFSSDNHKWATRWEHFDQIRELTGIDFRLDPCAEDSTAKCNPYFTQKDDGLSQCWNLDFFVNPPYGREQINWVKKAFKESEEWGTKGVLLIPARTDTNLFHNIICKQAKEVIFFEGRLVFGTDSFWEDFWNNEYIDGKLNKKYGKIGSFNAAPFPSMLVVIDSANKVKETKFTYGVKAVKAQYQYQY